MVYILLNFEYFFRHVLKSFMIWCLTVGKPIELAGQSLNSWWIESMIYWIQTSKLFTVPKRAWSKFLIYNQNKKRVLLIAAYFFKRNVPFIDTNRPNFSQLTSIKEWLNSLEMPQFVENFHTRRFLNLSQIVGFDRDDLLALEIWQETEQNAILESLKCIHFELNFQNGFLVWSTAQYIEQTYSVN